MAILVLTSVATNPALRNGTALPTVFKTLLFVAPFLANAFNVAPDPSSERLITLVRLS